VRRFFTFALPIDAAAGTADGSPAPDVALVDREEWRRLSAAIPRLPLSIRQPLLLCSIEGLSQAEAAQVLNISEKAVETRIYRARAKLSEILRG
jgi:RNA polymerase sigma-70 factor (ECF subfamily)